MNPNNYPTYMAKREKEACPPRHRPLVESKKVAGQLDTLLNYILRDFAASWFTVRISTEPAFLYSVERSVKTLTRGLVERLESIDTRKFIIEKLVQSTF